MDKKEVRRKINKWVKWFTRMCFYVMLVTFIMMACGNDGEAVKMVSNVSFSIGAFSLYYSHSKR